MRYGNSKKKYPNDKYKPCKISQPEAKKRPYKPWNKDDWKPDPSKWIQQKKITRQAPDHGLTRRYRIC